MYLINIIIHIIATTFVFACPNIRSTLKNIFSNVTICFFFFTVFYMSENNSQILHDMFYEHEQTIRHITRGFRSFINNRLLIKIPNTPVTFTLFDYLYSWIILKKRKIQRLLIQGINSMNTKWKQNELRGIIINSVF